MQIIDFKCLGCYCFAEQEKNFISDVNFNFIEDILLFSFERCL